MTEPWPPVPIRISGGVVLRIFGAELVTITLDLAIVATHRLAQWVGAIDQVGGASSRDAAAGLDEVRAEWTAPVMAPAREALLSRRRPELAENGGGQVDDGELQEILQLLEKTSRMLD